MTNEECIAFDHHHALAMGEVRRKVAEYEAARERDIARARLAWEAGRPARDAAYAVGSRARARLRSLGAPGRVAELGHHETLQKTWDVCMAPVFHLWLLCNASDASRLVAIWIGADIAEHAAMPLCHIYDGYRAIRQVADDSMAFCTDAIESARAYALDPSEANRKRCKSAGDAASLRRHHARAVDMPVLEAARCAAYAAAYSPNNVFGVSRHAVQAAYSNGPGGRDGQTRSLDDEHWQADHIREICPTCPIVDWEIDDQ